MKNFIQNILLTGLLLVLIATVQGQTLDVSIIENPVNNMQILGRASGSGFAAAPNNAWASMNLTWRIPKTATVPQPTSAPPAASPEVTNENTAFTGAAPRNTFNNSLDLTIFDATTFGEPDDGYWYFQVTGTQETVQNIATGQQIMLYEFTLPGAWRCPGCVEILTYDIPAFIAHGISTTSNIYNGGTGTDVLNIVQNNAPLPVEWLYVRAEPKDNNKILVSWATATEQNNAGYEVERSDDGSTYRAIGTVPGKRNSNTTSYYSFNDNQVLPGVKYYYRIKQIDLDGRAKYSVIVTAKLLTGNFFTVEIKPNPVRSLLNLEIQSSKKQTAQLIITDMTGRLYKIEKAIKLETTLTRYSTSVAGYLPGMYVAKVIASDGTVQTARFVIAH